MSELPYWTKKNVSVESLAKKAKKDKRFLKDLLEYTGSERAQMKFKSAKVLRHLSESDPKVLYPYWDHFEKRLSSDNTFLRSDAMMVLANLVAVDSKNRFDRILNKCYKQLDDESMIPAANLAGNSGKIAQAKPHLHTKIVNRLIKIDDTHHSEECKNIIKGKVIESFGDFYDQASPSNRKKMINFVKKETRNARNATRKKAERFLKKWGGTITDNINNSQ
jgi:hypothetical protein